MSRVCAEAINKKQSVPELKQKTLPDVEGFQRLVERLEQIPAICEEHFDSHNFYLVAEQIITTLFMTNSLVQETQPWVLVKNPDQTEQLNAVLALVFESLRVNAILLQPIIPNFSKIILDKLSVESQHRKWENSQLIFGHGERKLSCGSSKLLDRIKKN